MTQPSVQVTFSKIWRWHKIKNNRIPHNSGSNQFKLTKTLSVSVKQINLIAPFCFNITPYFYLFMNLWTNPTFINMFSQTLKRLAWTWLKNYRISRITSHLHKLNGHLLCNASKLLICAVVSSPPIQSPQNRKIKNLQPAK